MQKRLGSSASCDPADEPRCSRGLDLLSLTDFLDIHLSAPSASHVESVAIRRGDFEIALLFPENLRRILYFHAEARYIDHGLLQPS